MPDIGRNKTKKIWVTGGAVLFFCLFVSIANAGKPLPNVRPQAISITPSSGTVYVSSPTNFTSVYSDANGWQNLAQAKFLINTSTKGTNCFYAYYDQNTSKFYLRSDNNKSWLGGYAPGSANIIQNSYAILDCSRSSISGSGSTLSVIWSVTFKSTFTGIKNLYLYVIDDNGAKQGWIGKGTCTISQDTAPPIGTIKINNGAQYTNSTSVTLNLSATDTGSGVSQMQFSNDNFIWSTSEAFSTTKDWALSIGDSIKTVYVKFKDAVGNWSTVYSATIILDSIPPQINIISPQDNEVINP